MTDSLQPELCAKLLRALADPERLRLIQCLRSGPLNVGDLAARIDDEVVNVSHHLGVLRHSGLLLDEKQGRFVIYRLNPEFFPEASGRKGTNCIDLGCCQLDLPKP